MPKYLGVLKMFQGHELDLYSLEMFRHQKFRPDMVSGDG